MAAQHQAARRVAVEPVRQRRAARQPEPQRAESVFKAWSALRTAMHGNAGRLVDDQHQTVAVKKAGVYLFRRHAQQAIRNIMTRLRPAADFRQS